MHGDLSTLVITGSKSRRERRKGKSHLSNCSKKLKTKTKKTFFPGSHFPRFNKVRTNLNTVYQATLCTSHGTLRFYKCRAGIFPDQSKVNTEGVNSLSNSLSVAGGRLHFLHISNKD